MNYIIAAGLKKPFLKEMNKKNHLTAYDIIKTVSKFTLIPVDLIMSKRRSAEIVMARHISIYLIRNKFRYKYSLLEVSRLVGQDSHATALNSIKAVNNRVDTDSKFQLDITQLTNLIS